VEGIFYKIKQSYTGDESRRDPTVQLYSMVVCSGHWYFSMLENLGQTKSEYQFTASLMQLHLVQKLTT